MKLKEPSKNLKRVSCKDKEQALKELTKFINTECKAGGKHDFCKIELICGCSKCGSTFTVDKRIMEKVDIDRILDVKKIR